MRIYNAIANGAGGIDWSALPLFFSLWGVTDPEDMIDRLLVIKLHKPPGN
jgi:hypothetical protein